MADTNLFNLKGLIEVKRLARRFAQIKTGEELQRDSSGGLFIHRKKIKQVHEIIIAAGKSLTVYDTHAFSGRK